MSVVQTLIGNIKGPQGNTGATGATGDPGQAATITVGNTTTTAYGNAASVTNSGTSSAAVFDFVIPQGKPGEATTKMGDLLLDSITSSAADFPSPQVGDTGKTAFGKIVKFFSDTIAKFTQHESDMATISTSPTTQAFSTGEYLVYGGQLYRVTSNIANGGTLTEGTNITAVSAGNELRSIKAVSTETVTTSLSYVVVDFGYLRKKNGIVDINCAIRVTSAMNAWTNGTGNIPIGFRPANTVNMLGVIGSTGDAARVQISTGGAINFGKAMATGETMYFSGSYISE